MSKEELISTAFDMRAMGYGYEAIAEFLNTSIFYAKVLVTKGIEKEYLGTWTRSTQSPRLSH